MISLRIGKAVFCAGPVDKIMTEKNFEMCKLNIIA